MEVTSEQLQKVLAGFNSTAVDKCAEVVNDMVKKKLAVQSGHHLERVTVSDYPSQDPSWNVWHLSADLFGRRVHIQMHVKRK